MFTRLSFSQFPYKASDFYPDRLRDMMGYEFTVSTLPYAPFILKTSENKYWGLEIELATFLSKRYNFRCNYTIL